jgi:hypothetical protein
MIKRIVMVEFQPGVESPDIARFKDELQALAAHTPGLLGMTCGAHADSAADAALRGNAPNVVFGNFASVWEFRDAAAVEAFLTDPRHREQAGRWRAVVKQRYVINMQ